MMDLFSLCDVEYNHQAVNYLRLCMKSFFLRLASFLCVVFLVISSFLSFPSPAFATPLDHGDGSSSGGSTKEGGGFKEPAVRDAATSIGGGAVTGGVVGAVAGGTVGGVPGAALGGSLGVLGGAARGMFTEPNKECLGECHTVGEPPNNQKRG